MESENIPQNSTKYSLNCVYRSGKIYRSGISVNGTITDICKWNGQLVTSLMNTLDLKEYIRTLPQVIPEKLYEKMKELKYPLLNLCELTGLDINQIDVLDYIVKIHEFAIWLLDLINAKSHAMEYFKVSLSDVTMEYSSSKEYEGCSMVIYDSTNIFTLAQIEFAEYYKLGVPYIVCQKCNTIYFTHKVKSTKTCPFCECPSLNKDRRSIEKQAERLYNSSPETFEKKFVEYLTVKKGFSSEEALTEHNRQIEKRRKGE